MSTVTVSPSEILPEYAGLDCTVYPLGGVIPIGPYEPAGIFPRRYVPSAPVVVVRIVKTETVTPVTA
jgi:hypothetical protein